jgi:sporulation protein YlmC with PRC-barrel domain
MSTTIKGIKTNLQEAANRIAGLRQDVNAADALAENQKVLLDSWNDQLFADGTEGWWHPDGGLGALPALFGEGTLYDKSKSRKNFIDTLKTLFGPKGWEDQLFADGTAGWYHPDGGLGALPALFGQGTEFEKGKDRINFPTALKTLFGTKGWQDQLFADGENGWEHPDGGLGALPALFGKGTEFEKGTPRKNIPTTLKTLFGKGGWEDQLFADGKDDWEHPDGGLGALPALFGEGAEYEDGKRQNFPDTIKEVKAIKADYLSKDWMKDFGSAPNNLIVQDIHYDEATQKVTSRLVDPANPKAPKKEGVNYFETDLSPIFNAITKVGEIGADYLSKDWMKDFGTAENNLIVQDITIDPDSLQLEKTLVDPANPKATKKEGTNYFKVDVKSIVDNYLATKFAAKLDASFMPEDNKIVQDITFDPETLTITKKLIDPANPKIAAPGDIDGTYFSGSITPYVVAAVNKLFEDIMAAQHNPNGIPGDGYGDIVLGLAQILRNVIGNGLPEDGSFYAFGVDTSKDADDRSNNYGIGWKKVE